jgi:GTPase SAR1 family protein
MLIGGSGVGKTTFLRALASGLHSARRGLREGLSLESADLQELDSLTGEKSESGTNIPTAEPASYTFRIRDEGDPEVARWMRLQFSDYNGEKIAHRPIAPELLKKLRKARGLLFFVDERNFPDLLSNGEVVCGLSAGDHKDTAGLAARYACILQRYFEVNRDALHLPVALVVNKADLLLGLTNLLSLNPPVLIPEQTKMELVHEGLQVQAEPRDPFARLRCCIHHNLAISHNSQIQRFVFALIEQFKDFIAAAMCHTYRFQIFVTSSLVPKTQNPQSFPYGVWDVMKWMFDQLDPAYRLQADVSVERAYNELEEVKVLLSTAVLCDHEEHIAYLKAVAQRKQVMAKLRMNILDQLLQNRIEHASQQMQAALRDAFALAELPDVSDAVDPAPFALRRRLAEEALERLEYQIKYLTEWRERLSGTHKNVLLCPERPKNEVVPKRQSCHPATRQLRAIRPNLHLLARQRCRTCRVAYGPGVGMSLFVFSVTLAETCTRLRSRVAKELQGQITAKLDRTGPDTYSAVKAGKRFVDSTSAPRCKLHHLYTKSLGSESFNFRSS